MMHPTALGVGLAFVIAVASALVLMPLAVAVGQRLGIFLQTDEILWLHQRGDFKRLELLVFGMHLVEEPPRFIRDVG